MLFISFYAMKFNSIYTLKVLFIFSDIMENVLRIGISDMTEMSEINELGINENLNLRYCSDIIYVSFKKRFYNRVF